MIYSIRNIAFATLMTVLGCVTSTVSAAAKTCTWSGGTWSGGTWDQTPVDGDNIVIDNQTAGAIFDVDVDAVSINSLVFKSGGKNCYVVGGTITIAKDNISVNAYHTMTISNNLVLTSGNPRLASQSGTSSYCGDVTLTHATGNLRAYGVPSGANVKMYGTLTMKGDFYIGGGSNWALKNCYVYGPLHCRHVVTGNQYEQCTYHFYSTENSFTNLTTSLYAAISCQADYTLPETAIVYGGNHDTEYASGTLALNGHSQTVDRLCSATSKRSLTVTGGSGSPVLTLKGRANASMNGALNGPLSLVYAPTSSAFTQTINKGTSTMTGSITVSNGTLKVTGTASFKNVPAIYVADGATFDISEATGTSVLQGVTRIELGKNARFPLSVNNVTPFTDNRVVLRLDSTSEFSIPEGMTFYIKEYYVDGVRQDGGSYDAGTGPLKGAGSIVVEESEVPTVEATWDGGADPDTSMSAALNWADDTVPALTDGGLYPLFANSGSVATVPDKTKFKGLRFDGTSTRFELVGATSSAVADLYGLGLTVAANHVVTNNVTLKVKKPQLWTVGSGSTLYVDAPVTMDAVNAVTNLGPGKIFIRSENGYKGPLYFGTGASNRPTVEVDVRTNAFGEASGEKVCFYQKSSGAGQFTLRDTVVERPVVVSGESAPWDRTFVMTGTVRFTRNFNVNGVHFHPYVAAGGEAILEGGLTRTGGIYVYPEGNFTVRTTPLNLAYMYFEQNGTSRFRLECTGNSVYELHLTGAPALDCRCENAISMQNCVNFNGGKLYLNGYNQTIGWASSIAKGTVDSSTPAVWTTSLEAANTEKNCGIDFTGSAGFGLTRGIVTFTKSQASTNATVAVKGGTIVFPQDVTWLGATNVVVSSGRLVVNNGKTFKNAVVNLSATGKVEIPEGITMRCEGLTVNGVPARNGIYGSAESAGDKRYASNFSGGGVLMVGKLGFTVILR